MRGFSDKVVEKIKTQFIFNFFFSKIDLSCYDMETSGRAIQATDGNIIRRMRFAYWVTKDTGAHSEYVIFVAFTLQQWLFQRASMFR
jgi:hypothetical protein